MKTKTAYLMGVLIVLLFVILVVRLLIPKPKSSAPAEQQIPIFSAPPSSETINNPPADSLLPDLKVLSANFPGQALQPDAILKINFNKPVNFSEIKFEISPKIEVRVTEGASSNEVAVEPMPSWGFGVKYVIKILEESLAKDRSNLDHNYEYSFQSVKYAGF